MECWGGQSLEALGSGVCGMGVWGVGEFGVCSGGCGMSIPWTLKSSHISPTRVQDFSRSLEEELEEGGRIQDHHHLAG